MITTGLSGDEIFCVSQLGLKPGEILVGNSVYAMGMLGSIASSMRGMVGGEIPEISQLISQGRLLALERLEAEASKERVYGATGMRNRLVHHLGSSNIEFVAIGSGVHSRENVEQFAFSTSLSGQELLCTVDAGYQPKRFVFGSVAYSMGVAGGILGALKTMGRGEVTQYSDTLNFTRHLALQRLCEEAKEVGANCVVDIEVHIEYYSPGVTEMYMIGTACKHPSLGSPQTPYTSALPATELWSITSLGYAPLQLVLSSCVFSLGTLGGIKAALKSFTKGEISELTSLIYEARERALTLITQQAQAIGADDILGTRTFVVELSSTLIEFIAIGTAVKREAGVKTTSPHLCSQVFAHREETFFLFHRPAVA